jgi:hypothetical protein
MKHKTKHKTKKLLCLCTREIVFSLCATTLFVHKWNLRMNNDSFSVLKTDSFLFSWIVGSFCAMGYMKYNKDCISVLKTNSFWFSCNKRPLLGSIRRLRPCGFASLAWSTVFWNKSCGLKPGAQSEATTSLVPKKQQFLWALDPLTLCNERDFLQSHSDGCCQEVCHSPPEPFVAPISCCKRY